MCPSAAVPQGRGGERAADVTACVPARAGLCAGSVLAPCAGLTWSHSRKVVVLGGGCVGASGGGAAAGEATRVCPHRREHGAGVRLSCAESPLKICSLVSYWVLFLSPVLSRPGVL